MLKIKIIQNALYPKEQNIKDYKVLSRIKLMRVNKYGKIS
jgi:hypothetical protein